MFYFIAFSFCGPSQFFEGNFSLWLPYFGHLLNKTHFGNKLFIFWQNSWSKITPGKVWKKKTYSGALEVLGNKMFPCPEIKHKLHMKWLVYDQEIYLELGLTEIWEWGYFPFLISFLKIKLINFLLSGKQPWRQYMRTEYYMFDKISLEWTLDAWLHCGYLKHENLLCVTLHLFTQHCRAWFLRRAFNGLPQKLTLPQLESDLQLTWEVCTNI